MANANLATAEANLDLSELHTFQLQLDADLLTKRLEAAELEKQMALSDAKALAQILNEREQERMRVVREQTALKAQASKLLENATDDHTRSWAADSVPADLAGLLQQAADCANRDSHKTGACVAATGADTPMRNPGSAAITGNQPGSA